MSAFGGKADIAIGRLMSAFDPKRTWAASAGLAKLSQFGVLVASAAEFADTEDDQNERGCHEHPARMATARRPKVAESTKKVEAANEYTSCEPCVLLEAVCSGDQGEPAEEPADRAEMQEQRHEPSDRSGCLPVR
jgi:hypothetical protein